MARSDAAITLVVAIIGVIGAILPIYISNSIFSENKFPHIKIDAIPSNISKSGYNSTMFKVTNDGNAPATNLSITVDTSPIKIHKITNNLSTVEAILPNHNNTVLLSGSTYSVNSPLVKIQIPKFVHGTGSVFQFEISLNNSMDNSNWGQSYAVYDQGSITGETSNPYPLTYPERFNEFTKAWAPFYSIFYLLLFGLLILYIYRRKRSKKIHKGLLANLLEIRRTLHIDSANKTVFREVWFKISSMKRQNNFSISDYMMIDDFYSELKLRNSYVSESRDTDERYVVMLNTSLLADLEVILKSADWSKYLK